MQEINILNEENHVLSVRNDTQGKTIYEIHNDRAKIIAELDKYKGVRNHKGQFTSKEPKTEKVNEEV